jgi:hypothetical protein
MSYETDALLALRNAWTGALESADRLREAGAAVLGQSSGASIAEVDLEACVGVVLANANAAQALRGLVEELRRKAETAA